MRKRKTDEVVFGAMMMALFTILVIIDTYTGAMMNVLLYYLMPVPFVVYGLKYGLKMTACVGVGALILGMMFGLPETIFYSASAILIALVIVRGLSNKKDGSILFISVMLITTISQLLSMTLLAKLFGYDIVSEFNEVASWFPKSIISNDMIPMYIGWLSLLVGAMEAFIITSLCDIVLIRLKMQRLPKFSIMMLHFPKWIGCIAVFIMLGQVICPNNITQFLGVCMMMLLSVQGLSLGMILVSKMGWPRWIAVLMWLSCLIPYINTGMILLGLYDIFSEIRQNLLYNKNQL